MARKSCISLTVAAISPMFAFSLISFLLFPTSIATAHEYSEALCKIIIFFKGQRSGKLPLDQRLQWRKGSALHDGSTADVDLMGGYYDAGDNVKFGFPMAFMTMILSWSVINFRKTMGVELGNVIRAVKWGTDYLLKATTVDSIVYVH